jgi:hypothetical protein
MSHACTLVCCKMREKMSIVPPSSNLDLSHGPLALQQNLAALHDTLVRLNQQNRDAALQPLIADSLSRCGVLRQHLERLHGAQGGPEPIVDAQVFQRLMVLAGPVTALDLLDQLTLDLRAVQAKILLATPAQNWAVLCGQCHILIAVAGSIGAVHVQVNAEQLHKAATAQVGADVADLSAALIARLEALLAFVQNERQTRSTA